MPFPRMVHISKRLTAAEATDLLNLRNSERGIWLANRHAEWACWDCLGHTKIIDATTVVRLIRGDGQIAPTPLCTRHVKWRVGHRNFTC